MTMLMLMTMVVVVAMVIVPITLAMIFPALVMSVIPVFTMLFLIAWNVLAVVPFILHKIDTFSAGVVFAAVLTPMLFITGRYPQIDRRAVHRNSLDDSRLSIDHLRLRIAADINPAIKAWFTNANRDANVCCECRSDNGSS
jgi:uncharacterized membrane protein YhdT